MESTTAEVADSSPVCCGLLCVSFVKLVAVAFYDDDGTTVIRPQTECDGFDLIAKTAVF